MLGGGGLFATFSYIAPMMTGITGYADSSVTWLLVLFGLGMTAGNLAGARLSDRFPARTLLLSLTAEIAVALAFIPADHNRVTAALLVFLFPLTALAGLPALQGRVIAIAGGAPNLAAASLQAAFNIANSSVPISAAWPSRRAWDTTHPTPSPPSSSPPASSWRQPRSAWSGAVPHSLTLAAISATTPQSRPRARSNVRCWSAAPPLNEADDR